MATAKIQVFKIDFFYATSAKECDCMVLVRCIKKWFIIPKEPDVSIAC
jgi:hypothetical protein